MMTPQEMKDEEMNFLRSAGVEIKTVDTFEDALRMALR
jgi:hypothetical protein